MNLTLIILTFKIFAGDSFSKMLIFVSDKFKILTLTDFRNSYCNDSSKKIISPMKSYKAQTVSPKHPLARSSCEFEIKRVHCMMNI